MVNVEKTPGEQADLMFTFCFLVICVLYRCSGVHTFFFFFYILLHCAQSDVYNGNK